MQPIWRKSRNYYCYIEMLPFTIVVFVLLIIFLIIFDASFHHHHGTQVDLVKVRHVVPLPNALREDAMRVSVERDGRIYFQTEQVRVEDLPMRLREAMSTASEKKVYINADPRARYGTVVLVVDAVGAAGIRNVSFLTELKQ